MLWEDPILSFLSPQYKSLNLEEYYSKLSNQLYRAAQKGGCFIDSKSESGMSIDYETNHIIENKRLEFPALIAKVLSRKSHLRDKLAFAYNQGNHDALLDLTVNRLKPLRQDIENLWILHRKLWFSTYKVFGFEVIELRYGNNLLNPFYSLSSIGGLQARCKTLSDRLMMYLQKRIHPKSLSVDNKSDCMEDDESIKSFEVDDFFPEWQLELNMIYHGMNISLDYARCATPQRNLGSG